MVRKLTTGKSEDYTTGFLLHYASIKNNYRLTVIDLSRQGELDINLKAIQRIELVGQLKLLIVMVMLQTRMMTNVCFFQKF